MNKKLLLLTVLLFVCISLISCFSMDNFGHECTYSEWKSIKEATCKTAGKEARSCLICGDTETRQTSRADHIPVEFKGKEAGCINPGLTAGSYCESCNSIISGIEDIPALGHTEVIDQAVEPTDNKPGRTEGKHCSTCGQVFVKQQSIFSGEYSNPDRYHGDYGYNSLATLSNGKKMQEFYAEIDAIASDFHDSLNDAKIKKKEEKDVYYLAEVTYSDNGINCDEAFAVWSAYMKDHPLYYWMSKQISYNDDIITLQVDFEYIDGEAREDINADIYKTVEEYIAFLDGETSVYGITLGLHDVIINGADYAYMSDGVTPSNKKSANNIVGVLLEGEGVCESYAKSFQLILNYCGIENIYVTGYAGEPHGWNLVRLDDGRWYWYDLTWDDQPTWMLGVSYNYFCVSNSEFVDWRDGGLAGTKTFLQDHTPDSAGQVGVNYNYELPEASDIPYTYDGLMLRDEIIVREGLSYVLSGFNKISLINIDKEGAVTIPASINYEGEELTVVSIGKYDEEHNIFISGSVIYYDQTTREHIDVTSLTIPKTVEFIWDYAFYHCRTIESFSVSEDNPEFASLDGVLFTKSLYTLINYPLAKKGMFYSPPTEVVEIAYGAFGDGGNYFCPTYLKTLTIPTTVDVVGAANAGKGYRDEAPDDPSDILQIDGYVDKLRSMLGLGLIIE